jgi:polar amino acid transport system substrate-binding protein
MNVVAGKLAVGLVVFLIFFNGPVLATKLNIVTEHLPPYQIVSEDSIKGLSTEIVEATLKESQYAYDIKAYPWALSFGRAKHHKNTCIYSITRTSVREPLFKWIGHIVFSTMSMYSLKNNLIVIANLEEAKKYNIAVTRSDVSHQFLLTKGFEENENLYVIDNDRAILKFLGKSSRNIDLVVLTDDIINKRVNKWDERSKYRRVYQFKELALNFYFACSLNTEQKVIDNLIIAMKVLEKRGVFLEIRNKWKEQSNFHE